MDFGLAKPVEDDEDVDGVVEVPEDLPEEVQRELECWNKTVRGFVSLSHERRRMFVQWAVGMCVDPDADPAAEEDQPEIPAFLRRDKSV